MWRCEEIINNIWLNYDCSECFGSSVLQNVFLESMVDIRERWHLQPGGIFTTSTNVANKSLLTRIAFDIELNVYVRIHVFCGSFDITLLIVHHENALPLWMTCSSSVLRASVSICHRWIKRSHHILIYANHSAWGRALWKSPIVCLDRIQLRALPLSCSCWPEQTGVRLRTAGMWRWAMTGFLSLLFDVLPPSGS